MSAQKIQANYVDIKALRNETNGNHPTKGSSVALGIILLVFAIVIMASVLIFMCLSGNVGESMLFIGIVPFVSMFMLLMMSR